MRIALVEDDPAQTELIRGWLVEADHDCHHFETGKAFLRELRRESFDVVILDWGLPDTTGIDVLAQLRVALNDATPVLFVTVRDREEDVVEALRMGANDYMSKPVSRGETLARIDVLLRRAVTPSPTIEAPPYRLEIGTGALSRDGVPVPLTQKEFALAAFLFRNVNRLVSRGHILEQVWGTSPDLNTRTVDTHVSRLRGKLGLTPGVGWRLRAVYQHGYRLEQVDQGTQ